MSRIKRRIGHSTKDLSVVFRLCGEKLTTEKKSGTGTIESPNPDNPAILLFFR